MEALEKAEASINDRGEEIATSILIAKQDCRPIDDETRLQADRYCESR